jgi:hypothetical protein
MQAAIDKKQLPKASAKLRAALADYTATFREEHQVERARAKRKAPVRRR